MPEQQGYYLQDTRDIVGNSMVWWEKGGGYTTDIERARVFSKAEADKKHSQRPTDLPWRKDYIDARIRKHVDVQHVDISDPEAA